LALLGAPGVGAETSAAARPAGVVRVACTTSTVQAQRTATWQGRMRRVARAHTMQMRFKLQARQRGQATWAAVAGENLGQWQTSLPNVRRYVFDKQVKNLPAGAAYRVLVEFRWLDRAGKALRSLKLRSRACNQPDVRPDLVVANLVVTRLPDGSARYRVAVRNAGTSGAGPSSVRVAGPLLLPLAGVGALQPGERAVVVLRGPGCTAGEPVAAAADAAGEVSEADESNNTRTIPCP
jgi:hypothetical protein